MRKKIVALVGFLGEVQLDRKALPRKIKKLRVLDADGGSGDAAVLGFMLAPGVRKSAAKTFSSGSPIFGGCVLSFSARF